MKQYIMIGGSGERMKAISPLDKQNLYYGNETILELIYKIFPDAELLGAEKTNSRRETLSQIAGETDCLIIDCDVIPNGCEIQEFETDTIYAFMTNAPKYCSLVTDGKVLLEAHEHEHVSQLKASGVYYIKSIDRLLERMKDDNSIASGMIGAKVIQENSYIRLGDVADYYEALGL